MSGGAWLQLAAFLALLLALAWPLARAIEAVMAGRFALGQRLEAPVWRLAGVDPAQESGWLRYLLGLLVFPLITLFLTVLSFSQLGEGLKDRFDPVLR